MLRTLQVILRELGAPAADQRRVEELLARAAVSID
jgi:hypothetical protein